MHTLKAHLEEIAAGDVRVWRERRRPDSGCHRWVRAGKATTGARLPLPPLGFTIIGLLKRQLRLFVLVKIIPVNSG